MNQEQESKSNESVQVEGRWTKEQHEKFIKALMEHGKNWKLIENSVQTRTTSQVRSHAQKFFLKLVKIQKQRKKNLKKGLVLISRAQEQLIKSLSRQSLSQNTPIQILQFLKKQAKGNNSKRSDQILKQVKPLKKQKACQKNAILTEMFELQEDQSFFVSLMYHINRYSKHNKNFIKGEQDFADLIDFPFILKEQKEEEETSNKRKISFSLYEEEQDSKKYKEMIKKMHGE